MTESIRLLDDARRHVGQFGDGNDTCRKCLRLVSNDRERRPQVVGDPGDERLLQMILLFQLCLHLVDRVNQLSDFILRSRR